MSRSTLRGSRVEFNRAGITPTIRNALMQPSLSQQRTRFSRFYTTFEAVLWQLTGPAHPRIIVIGMCGRTALRPVLGRRYTRLPTKFWRSSSDG